MKSATKLLLGLLLLATPIYAQDPTDFEGWNEKANTLLNAPGEGENEVRREWDKGYKAEAAAKAFLEAARLAPNDAAKFKSLDSAGAAFAKGHGTNKQAVEAYRAARDITTADPDERARVGLAAGKLSSDIADFEKVVAIEGASGLLKSQAYAEIGVKSGIAKDSKKAAESYFAAAQLDKTKADSYLDSASVYAKKIEPRADAEAMVDRVHKAKLQVVEDSDKTADEKAASRPYLLANWARDLNDIGAKEKAIAAWQQAAESPKAVEQTRYDSLKSAATEAHNLKNYDLALTLWAKAGQVSPDSYVRVQETTLGRSNAQLSKGDYAKARDELNSLLVHPRSGPREKEGVLLTQSGLYFDEADDLEKKNAPLMQIASSEAGGFKIMDDIWAAPTSSDAAMLQIAIQRVERNLKRKDYATAHNEVKTAIEKFTARGFGTEWLQQLHVLNGDIYRGEKQYVNSMISYSTGILRQSWNGAALVPNQPIYSAALGMLTEATNAKSFDDAHKIVEWLDKWQVPLDPTVLYKIELEIKAGNKDAARELITKNKAAIFQEDSKKKLAELEAQLNAG